MDLHELKLESLKNIKVVNCPDNINLGIVSTDDNIKVVIYYIEKFNDVDAFVRFCSGISLPENNTTILLYKKGRHDDVNLNSIYLPFKEGKYPNFRLKVPVLGTLQPDYLGALIMSRK